MKHEDRLVRIARLENEVQSLLLAALLEERGIPHVIRSYHDSAYDGVFQSTLGWGCVEAQEKFRAEILAALRDLETGVATDDEPSPAGEK